MIQSPVFILYLQIILLTVKLASKLFPNCNFGEILSAITSSLQFSINQLHGHKCCHCHLCFYATHHAPWEKIQNLGNLNFHLVNRKLYFGNFFNNLVFVTIENMQWPKLKYQNYLLGTVVICRCQWNWREHKNWHLEAGVHASLADNFFGHQVLRYWFTN